MEPANAPLIVLKQIAGNEPTHLNALQSALAPHLHTLTVLWFSIWCATAFVVLVKLAREYAAHRKDGV